MLPKKILEAEMKNKRKPVVDDNCTEAKKRLQKRRGALDQSGENKVILPDASHAEMDAQTLWQTMRPVLPDFSFAQAKAMIAQDSAQQRVKAEYGRLFDEVAALLFRHDPEDISYGRAHTYELEAGIFIPRLRSCRSSKDVRRVVHEAFARCCGRHVKPEKDYTKIAKEIWGLWQKFNGPKH